MRSTIFIAVVAAGLAAIPVPVAAQDTLVVHRGVRIEGLEGLRGLEALAGLQGLQGLEGLKGLEKLKGLEGLRGLEGLWNLSALQGLQGLQSLGAIGRVDGAVVFIDDDLPGVTLLLPEPHAGGQETPADSLYRAAREALNRGDYRTAATMFSRLESRYPESSYAGDALYWRAFALYRVGGKTELKRAKEVLKAQKEKYPKARTLGDAGTLAVRIDGALAGLGEASSAERVTRGADSVAKGGCLSANGEDEDVREAALSALQHMDSDRAIPILKQVLAKRDACSARLRRTAVFILSQKRSPETEQLLLDAARQDPSREVRKQAVFWLGQVNTERAAAALDSIARRGADTDLREQAVQALSQQSGERAARALREIAGDSSQPSAVREQAVFWMGQQRSTENMTYLRQLFDRTTSDELREKILFSLSQQRGMGNESWLRDVATNARYGLGVRKQAIFSMGQAGGPVTELVALYDRLTERELKEQTIFVLGDRRETAATDKLVAIAKGDKDPEMRKKAIFWLGQSRDPRVQQLLLDIING